MGLHTCVCNPILYQKQLAQESKIYSRVDVWLEKRQPLSETLCGIYDKSEELVKELKELSQLHCSLYL